IERLATFLPVKNSSSNRMRGGGERGLAIKSGGLRRAGQSCQRMIAMTRRECGSESVEMSFRNFQYGAEVPEEVTNLFPLAHRHVFFEGHRCQTAGDPADGAGHGAPPARGRAAFGA